MTAEELAENERYWREENDENPRFPTDAPGEMRGVGVSGAGITADLGGTEEVDPEAEPILAGGEATPPLQQATRTPGWWRRYYSRNKGGGLNNYMILRELFYFDKELH